MTSATQFHCPKLYSLVQRNWFSDGTDACNSGASSDHREPISLHQAVQPGLHLPAGFEPTREGDFSSFFPPHVVDAIVEYTSAYAQANIAAKLSHANKDGEWTPTTREEIYRLLAVLFYQALNRLQEVKDYWCTESLFAGNYVCSMIPSQMRFDALLCFLKVVDHEQEDHRDLSPIHRSGAISENDSDFVIQTPSTSSISMAVAAVPI